MLDMLKPDRDAYVIRKLAEQKIAHDRRAQDHEWFLRQSEDGEKPKTGTRLV